VVKLLACALLAVMVRAEDHPLPNPEVLKWQFEAQERERAINRRIDYQQTEGRKREAEFRFVAPKKGKRANPKVVHVNRPANNPR